VEQPRLTRFFGAFEDPELEAAYRSANATGAAFRAGLVCLGIAIAWSGSITHDLVDLEGLVQVRTMVVRMIVVSLGLGLGGWLLWRHKHIRWETTHAILVVMLLAFLVHVAFNNTAFIGSETTLEGVIRRFGNISNWMTTTTVIGMIGLFSQLRLITAVCVGLFLLYVLQLVIHAPADIVPYTAGTVMILSALGAGYGVALTINRWTRRSFYLVVAHREQKQAAETARSLVASLLSATGHDVQQPLQALLLNAERLNAAQKRGDQAQAAALAAEQRELLIALNALMSGVLEFSALDSAKRRPSPQRVSVRALFRQVTTLLGPMAKAQAVQLRVAGPDRVLQVDEASALRILINLVSNALAHSGATRVLLGVRGRPDRQVDLIVADNGRGLGPEPVIIEGIDGVAAKGRRRGFGLEIMFALADHAGTPLRLSAKPRAGTWAALTCQSGENAA
jgi:signal transduction histidine kinase